MRRDSLITLLVLGGLLTLAAGFVWYFTADTYDTDDRSALLETANTIASSSLTRYDKEPFDLASYQGMPTIVYVWASWVPSAPSDLALLDELAATEPTGQLAVLAINRSDPESGAIDFLAQYATPNITIVRDTVDSYFQTVAGLTMPTTLYYDSDGALVRTRTGAIDARELGFFSNQIQSD
jgi:thiol-disulfide isomerase/thioredoxin